MPPLLSVIDSCSVRSRDQGDDRIAGPVGSERTDTRSTRVRRPAPARRPLAVLGLRGPVRPGDAARHGRTAVGVIASGLVLLLLGGLGLVHAATAAAAGCAAGSSVTIVAHPDDDLFFINPAILRDVQAGLCSTTVFATSGDSGDTSGIYYQDREAGLQAA